jgi:hypothetical protein
MYLVINWPPVINNTFKITWRSISFDLTKGIQYFSGKLNHWGEIDNKKNAFNLKPKKGVYKDADRLIC